MADELPDIELSGGFTTHAAPDPFSVDLNLSPDIPEEDEDKGFLTEAGEFAGSFIEGGINEVLAVGAPEAIGRGQAGVDLSDSDDYGDVVASAIGQGVAQAGIIATSTKAGAVAGGMVGGPFGAAVGAAGGAFVGAATTLFQGIRRAQYGTRQSARDAFVAQQAAQGLEAAEEDILAIEEDAADKALWTNVGGEAVDTAFAFVTGGTGGGLRATVKAGKDIAKTTARVTARNGFKQGVGTALAGISKEAAKREVIKASLTRAGRFKLAAKEALAGASGEGTAEVIQGAGERAAVRSAVGGEGFISSFGDEITSEQAIKDFGVGAIAQGTIRGGAMIRETGKRVKATRDVAAINEQAEASADLSKARPLAEGESEIAEGAAAYERISNGTSNDLDSKAAMLNKIYHDLDGETDGAIFPPDFAPTEVLAKTFADDPDIVVRPLEDGSTEISLRPDTESKVITDLRRQAERKNYLKNQLEEVTENRKSLERQQDTLIMQRNHLSNLNEKLNNQVVEIDNLLAEDRQLRSKDQPTRRDPKDTREQAGEQQNLIPDEREESLVAAYKQRRKDEKAAQKKRAADAKAAGTQANLIPTKEIAGRDVSDISALEGFLSKEEKDALRAERRELRDEMLTNVRDIRGIEADIELMTSTRNDGKLDRLRLQEQRVSQELENINSRLYDKPADQLGEVQPTPIESVFNYKDRKKDALKHFKFAGPKIQRERGFDLNKIRQQPIPDRFRADIKQLEAFDPETSAPTSDTGLNSAEQSFVAAFKEGAKKDIKRIREKLNKDNIIMYMRRKGTVERGLGFTPEQGEAIVESKFSNDNYVRGIIARAEGNLRRLSDMISEQENLGINDKVINEALQGDIVALSELPPRIRNEVDKMRIEVDKLSDELIDSGMLNSRMVAIVKKNKGAYLTRQYRLFENPAKHIDEVVKNHPVWERAQGLFRQQLPEQAVNESDAAYDKRINDAMREFLIELGGQGSVVNAIASNVKSGKPSKVLSILKHRKDIPLEIRELMGEYTDAPTNYINSMHKMAALLAGHRYMSDVRDIGVAAGFLADPDSPLPHTTELLASKGSNVMSPLNGYYTTPEFKQAFEEAFAPAKMSGFWKMFVGAAGAVRLGKTVLSVQTHPKNFFGNTYFLAANGNITSLIPGLNNGEVSGVKNATKAILGDFNWSNRQEVTDLLQRYVELGVFQGFEVKEFEMLLKDLQDSNDNFQTFQKLREARYSPVRLGEKFLTGAKKLYAAEDTFFKVVTFEAERAKLARRPSNEGKSASELDRMAARITRDTMPTYELIPEAVQSIRRNPILGPFVSFHAESVRNTVNTAKLALSEISEGTRLGDTQMRNDGFVRLASLAATGLIPAGAAYAFNLTSQFDDEKEKALRTLAPWWDQHSPLGVVSVDGEGNPTYINTSSITPHQSIVDPTGVIIRAANDPDASMIDALGHAAIQFAEPFIAEGLLSSSIIDIARNINEDTGSRIYNENDTLDNILGDMISHLWDKNRTGTHVQVERMTDALTGKVGKSGLTRDPWIEALAIASGVRANQFNLDKAAFYTGTAYRRHATEATRAFSKLADSPATLSDSELKEAFDTMIRLRKFADRQVLVKIDALRKLGKTQPEIYHQFTKDTGGPGKEKSRVLTLGQQPPLRLSKQLIRGILKVEGRAEQIERIMGRPLNSDLSDLIELE